MYIHGSHGQEIPTSLIPMTNISASIPVVVGTAPVHLVQTQDNINVPILCYNLAEAVEKLGYSEDWEKYTLCEFMKSFFELFNVAPVVFINVLDSKKHKKNILNQEVTVASGMAIIKEPIILSTLKVKKGSLNEYSTINVDYTVAYDEENLVITILPSGNLNGLNKIIIDAEKLDVAAVSESDIIGGVDISSGKITGLELVNEVYPRFGLIPGVLVSPQWSTNPLVGAVLKSKTTNINGCFNAIALVDIPTDIVKKYSDISSWKNKNNYVDKNLVACWPKVKLGDNMYYLSTQLAGAIAKTDSMHDDIPYWSPSNQSLQCSGACLQDNTDVFLDTSSAQYLNGQGVVTAINFIGGWKAWGNRTSVYPSNTDVKDNFISIRRMFNWINNTLITTFWSKIDNPVNTRLIATIVDSANVWLNGLTAKGYLVGGHTEFRQEDNPTTDLMDGKIVFHVFITPPSPAREIVWLQEYAPSYLKTLFKR